MSIIKKKKINNKDVNHNEGKDYNTNSDGSINNDNDE